MSQQPLSRRNFVTGAGALGAVTIFAPQALAARGRRMPTLRGGRFRQGVVSGDPTPTSITLWTKVDGVGGRGSVELEVARDRGFRRVVARKLIPTSGSIDHAVKARVGGLKAHEQYYYRFSTRSENSPAGRFRTALPPDSRQPVRFAFFSCQDFSFGQFNAHRLLAGEDVDFVVNLGDYIYAEAPYSPTSPRGGVRTDRVGEAVTLADYRRKYDLYRSDAALRGMHARFPMISVWDDHEVQNNYAGGAGADGGLAPALGYSLARKRAGYRAYFENMPTFASGSRKGTRIYRAVRFGRNVDLILLDQRQYRADQPCGDKQVGPPCPELNNPRPFLGRRQMDFLKTRLDSTPAAWKFIANQTMVNAHPLPGRLVHRVRLLAGLPARAHRDARAPPANANQGRRVHHRRHPHPDRRRRADQGQGQEAVGHRVRGRVDHVTRPSGREAADHPGRQPHNPNTPQGHPRHPQGENPWVKDADTDHHGYGLVEAKQGTN